MKARLYACHAAFTNEFMHAQIKRTHALKGKKIYERKRKRFESVEQISPYIIDNEKIKQYMMLQ